MKSDATKFKPLTTTVIVSKNTEPLHTQINAIKNEPFGYPDQCQQKQTLKSMVC